jgi:hypothetical protein
MGSNLAAHWDALSEHDRTAILMLAGWRTNQDKPSRICRRLLRQKWIEIAPSTQNVIVRFWVQWSGVAQGA